MREKLRLTIYWREPLNILCVFFFLTTNLITLNVCWSTFFHLESTDVFLSKLGSLYLPKLKDNNNDKLFKAMLN